MVRAAAAFRAFLRAEHADNLGPDRGASQGNRSEQPPSMATPRASRAFRPPTLRGNGASRNDLAIEHRSDRPPFWSQTPLSARSNRPAVEDDGSVGKRS
jgi:hypothetical protein